VNEYQVSYSVTLIGFDSMGQWFLKGPLISMEASSIFQLYGAVEPLTILCGVLLVCHVDSFSIEFGHIYFII
jgi:hypothetical protein